MAYLSAEERRQSIIDAAIEVIATEGLQKATTRRIAQQADAPLGALHYCFRSKEELIHLVAEQGAARLRTAFDGVDPALGVEATIRDSVAALWRWARKHPGLQLALMELGMWRIREGGPPEEVYSMWDNFGGNLVREHLQRAVNLEPVDLAISVEEIVRFINHRFDGLAFEWAASRDEAACERQTHLLADAMVLLALGGGAQSGATGGATGGATTSKPAAAARKPRRSQAR
ncbi:TetR/AcrR family transcriptional regulator [Virgisporangium aurantiacum]|uniref:HTH tetR-type domain-containing protein n=1 Tax=Virgisporangium aurantiacum TaxID=175570 RepID=A0A8J3ZFW3_9ACTN|nr:TetR/AcrR family transcriptional regulator [Virgisporangium aurantiacum]GIJ63194.1 hypothetical protein Vau01_107100 [Virgisporangium aurantiacum]